MSSKIFSLSTWLEAQFSVTGVSQDIPGNKTTYTINFHVRRTNSESFQYADDVTYKATGPGLNLNTTIYKSWTTISSSWVLYYTQQVTVTHNTNGVPPTTSWTFSLVAPSSGWSGSSSMTYALPTIPRASSFTLSGSTRTNADINVTIAKKSSSFNHRVRWRISGSTSWKTVQDSSWSGTSTSFKVQPSDIPNSKSKEIVVGVQTYNGTTAIGSEVTSRRTITIPNTTISLSGTANTGSSQTVSISNSGGSLTYTRSWKLGSATGTNSSTWTPSHSALPNSTSGTLTCTVVTKNGTATINTTSATRTITVPASVMPSVGTIAHSEQNSTVSSLVGAYVQNVSLIKFTPTFTAGSGATISSRKITYRSQTTNQSTLTAIAYSPGDDLVCSATVTDSRGRTATNSVTITVLPYQKPIVTGVSFTRSNSDGTPNTVGTYLTIKATIRVHRLVVGSTEKNKIWYQSQTAQLGSSYTTKTDLANQAGTISGNYRQSVYTHTFSGYPVDYPYNVRVRGGDIFSWSGYIAGGIPTGLVLQHWGESTTAFGKMIDSLNYNVLVGAKGMQVDGPAEFKKGIKIPDTRSVVSQPQDLPSYALSLDFKSNSSVGNPPVTAGSTYSHIINVAGWSSNEGSGGWPTQISVGGSGLAVRQATSATAWGPWRNLYHSGNRPIRYQHNITITYNDDILMFSFINSSNTAYTSLNLVMAALYESPHKNGKENALSATGIVVRTGANRFISGVYSNYGTQLTYIYATTTGATALSNTAGWSTAVVKDNVQSI